MLAKLHVLVSKNLEDRWEARILEADFLPRAGGATLTELLKELYALIAADIGSARAVGMEPFHINEPASAEIKAAFDAAQTSLEWLNPPIWADQLPTLEIRCIG